MLNNPGYVVIVEAEPVQISLDIYQYSSFTTIVESGTKTISKEILNDSEAILNELLKYAAEVIPAKELARTPLYLYGVGPFNDMDDSQRDDHLRSACKYLKDNSNFLIEDCSNYVDYIDERNKSGLSWIAANYPDGQHGVIDWSNSSLSIAYPSQSGESGPYRVALGNVTNLAMSSFDDDYSQNVCESWINCSVSLPSGLPPVPPDIDFVALDRFTTFFDKYHGLFDEAEQCEGDCYAAKFGFELKEALNVTSISAGKSKWTLGRAVLYAAFDNGLDPVGIQPSTDSRTWMFGKDDSLKRPPKDVGMRLDARSHRFWGGIALLFLLAAAFYFLLGSERRRRIWAGITRRPYNPVENDIQLEDVDVDEFRVD